MPATRPTALLLGGTPRPPCTAATPRRLDCGSGDGSRSRRGGQGLCCNGGGSCSHLLLLPLQLQLIAALLQALQLCGQHRRRTLPQTLNLGITASRA